VVRTTDLKDVPTSSSRPPDGLVRRAVDINDEKLELAKELGADHVVNALTEEPVAAINALRGAHAAISVAVAPKAVEQAFGSLRGGRTLVFVALPADNFVSLPIFETGMNGITVLGSIMGTRRLERSQ
jgi:propanol-preferring alcohol dehydrogenase